MQKQEGGRCEGETREEFFLDSSCEPLVTYLNPMNKCTFPTSSRIPYVNGLISDVSPTS